MPPVAKAGGNAFRKDVEFVAKDDEEQIAAGIVMVPDKADLQNDFAREETIREFAEQFGNFAEVGEASGGVMHAVWPDDWMSLERNEVLDEATMIGGTEAPAGAWVQEWSIDHADLWALITDGILEGYSIGAVDVRWNGPFEQDADAVDDVDVPDAVGEDELIWELVSGIVREVSAVDIPAVPDAEILETKADADKRLADHLGDRDGFVEEAMDRGHSEAEAERLWDVLNEAADIEGAGDPGEKTLFHRIGKAAVDTFLGEPDTSDAKSASEPPSTTDKEGRTLSKANRDSVMASIDAGLDVLEDAGVDHGMTRFTDQEDVDFDLDEHEARSFDETDSNPFEVQDAAGGETPADAGSTTAADDMSDDSETTDEDKSLAEQNAEQINELTDAVKSLTEAVENDGDSGSEGTKTAEVELPSGELVEVSKSEVEEWFEDGDGTATKDTDDEEVTKADIEALHARLDAISREAAGSQQLDRNAGDGDGGDDGKLSEIGKALS